MIFRLTQKLGTKIKAGRLSESPLDENPFADWSCNLFTAGRTQYIIVSNTASLYSCVMHAKGITNEGRFVEQTLSTIREFMEADEQVLAYQKLIAPASGSITFAKSLNRSVTGSMNDLIRFAKHWLAEDDLSPHDVGFELNDILLSALATTKSQGYGRPNEAFKAMFTSHLAINKT
ncbi:MAG: hypothetical protein KDA87_18660 [Planctomycetales bacterium]|nr:hypothetical protein [Planctomycetales bacterium]